MATTSSQTQAAVKDRDLTGRVALVTGGTRGIGAAICRALAADGAAVAAGYSSNQARADELRQSVEAAGGTLSLHQGNIGDAEDCERVVKEVIETHGRLDILVNNAGITVDKPVWKLSPADWDKVLKVDLSGAFYMSKPAIQHMIGRGSGRIINISSVEGKHGKPAIPAYVTCKHALIGLTKSIAKENGTSGITCNAICPGLVWTDVLVATGPDSAKEMGLTFDQMVDLFAQETALKRISTVEEVAAVAVLLASDIAAGITGSAYNVDGGTAAY